MVFPRDKDQYVLGTAIGTAPAATMYAAKHVSPETGNEVPVGIKIVDINKIENIYSLTKEIHEAETCDHDNIIKVHCSFKVSDKLWLVISPLPRFSLRSMIRSSFPNGLPRNTVSFILKETLKAVHYLHENDKLHQGIGADCIFLDDKSSTVKVSLYSLSFQNSSLDSSSKGFPKTSAPEVMNDYGKRSDKATDIWMFGMLALELFYGQFPASDLEEFQFLLEGIEKEFGTSKKKESHGGSKASGSFGKFRFFSCFIKRTKKIPRPLGEVMAACLAADPKKRPTTNQLSEFNLFQQHSVGQESLAKLKKQCK